MQDDRIKQSSVEYLISDKCYDFIYVDKTCQHSIDPEKWKLHADSPQQQGRTGQVERGIPEKANFVGV